MNTTNHKAFNIVAYAIERVRDIPAKTALARDLVAYSIGALATLEGADRAAQEVHSMADKVRVT